MQKLSLRRKGVQYGKEGASLKIIGMKNTLASSRFLQAKKLIKCIDCPMLMKASSAKRCKPCAYDRMITVQRERAK